MNSQGEFLTSVVMITYNHEVHIAQAIESVLSQNFDSPLELIISNDRSPDDTERIVLDIINSHPRGNIIKYTKHERNLGMSSNFFWSLNQAKGKYVALCEGDDSWTDPNKLQKQIDFLEENNEYGLTCGGFTSLNCATGEKETWLKDIKDDNAKFSFGFDIEIERFWKDWCIQTLTVVYRRDLFDFNELSGYNYKNFIDIHLYYYLIKQKKGFYFREIFANMNLTDEGVYSNKPILDKLRVLYLARREISRVNKDDKILKSKLFNVASKLFVNKEFVKKHKDLNRRRIFKDMLYSIQSYVDIKHTLKCIFTPKKI